MYLKLIKYLLFIFLIFISLSTYSITTCNSIVNIQQIKSEKDLLIKSLLALSLSKTAPEMCISESSYKMSISRQQLQVENDQLDVLWTSADLKDSLSPIRIPIFKGFLGYRLLVIRQGGQVVFNRINSLTDLKDFTAGLGRYWGDTPILFQAGIPMITTQAGDRLWEMLANKRFDYFPLAIHEPWEELNARSKLNLTTEKNILLSYPSGLYFHVNKSNVKLFNLISSGMKLAVKDGSYNKLIQQSTMIKNTVKFANIAQRKLIKLDNKALIENTPKENLKYWLTHKELISFIEQAKSYH